MTTTLLPDFVCPPPLAPTSSWDKVPLGETEDGSQVIWNLTGDVD